jgi:hypothetical protein
MSESHEPWWKQPERVISTLALTISVISFALSYLQSQRGAVTSVMPVLVFVYEQSGQWVLQNLGNGPALNVVVAEKASDNSAWSNPIRIPPLPREGRFPLRVDVNARWLAASYNDIQGHDYSATSVNDDSRVRAGRVPELGGERNTTALGAMILRWSSPVV